MSTRVPEVKLKLISFKERDSLEKTVRQVCRNDQRFDANVVMYNISLIRGTVLTWSGIVLLQELAINRHHERVTFWIR